MPSTYAHFKFGQEIYKRLPESIKKSVDLSPQLFAAGQHGPDILFYYNVLKSNPVNRIGYGMHAKPAADFFVSALSVLRDPEDDAAERAYIYGFVCHFMLDSCVHWYVEDAISEYGVPHTSIEADFDRMLMEEDGLDPVRHMTASHIIPSQENAAAIAKFFPQLSARHILKSLKDMRFYSNLIVCRSALKRRAMLAALKMLGHYDTIGGMIIRPKADERCRISTPVLKRLFDTALDEAEKYLKEFENAIETGKPLSERFYRTFGPDKESREEYEIYTSGKIMDTL